MCNTIATLRILSFCPPIYLTWALRLTFSLGPHPLQTTLYYLIRSKYKLENIFPFSLDIPTNILQKFLTQLQILSSYKILISSKCRK